MMMYRNILTRAICVGALLTGWGCTSPGIGGSAPEVVKAKYTVPQVPTVVLVESYGNAGDATLYADQLGVALVRELQDHKIGQIVDPESLAKLHEQNPNEYDKMTIDGIGRALAAKQVIYVNVLRAEVEIPEGSESARGQIACVTRVVDSTSGETRWPSFARDGEVIQIQTPWLQSDSPEPRRPDVQRDMVNRMADAIAKLFYDWEPENPMQKTAQPAPNPGS
jgi:hypothetical protein